MTHVDGNASTVKSIIDTTFSASVDVGSGNTVTASGDFSLMSKGMLKISYLEEGTGIASGDSVVTSGKGGVFPQGLLIGYVPVQRGGQSEHVRLGAASGGSERYFIRVCHYGFQRINADAKE